jgi:hypothetical protein
MSNFIGDFHWKNNFSRNIPQEFHSLGNLYFIQLDTKSTAGEYRSKESIDTASTLVSCGNVVLLAGLCPEKDYQLNPKWRELMDSGKAIFYSPQVSIDSALLAIKSALLPK